MAVHANQQRHRNQRGFPEEIEEEQIERNKYADQGCFQDQQQDEEFLDPLVDGFPRDQYTKRREESGQHDQPHGDPVHPHVIMNVGASRSTAAFDFVLKAGWPRLKCTGKCSDRTKASRETTSANTRMSRSRRGKNSSSKPPASGMNVTSVRMMLFEPAHRVPIQTM